MFNDWLTRRMMTPTGPTPPHSPIHWWSGEDNLQSGGDGYMYLFDRINGLGWSAEGGSLVHNSDNYVCGKNVGYLAMNFNAASPAGLRIGRYWRMEVDFEVDSFDSYYPNLVIADFGSLQNARHAFGLMSDSPYNTIIDNYKPFSNDTSYATTASLGTALSVGTRKIISFGCEKYDATNDVQYIEIDGVKTYGAPHAQTTFDANFYASHGYIGRGMLTNYCGGSIKLYDLKIYNFD